MTNPVNDRTAPVWQAVATLESNFYTRAEIAAALREVADDVEPEHA